MPTRDDSAYILLHDDFFEHPKIEPLTDPAIVLFVRHLTYAHRLRTNGRLSASRWAKIGKPKTRAELLATSPGQRNPLVHDRGDYFEIHDYLDWQQSSEEIDAAQARAAEAGSLGNHRRWHKNRGVTDDGCRWCSQPESAPESQTRSVPRIGGAIAK